MINDPYPQSKFAIDGKDITITGLQNSIVFSLQVAGETIVSETYNYDNEGKVVIRGIADIVSKALYGTLETGLQDKARATVNFLVDGVVQFTKTLYASRFMNILDPNGAKKVLAVARHTVCHYGSPFYLSAIHDTTIVLHHDGGVTGAHIGTNGTEQGAVYTKDCDPSTFGNVQSIGGYMVVGDNEMIVDILPPVCDGSVPIRFLNRYDVMESVMAKIMTEKPSVNDEVSSMYGQRTRFTVKSATEYSVQSGKLLYKDQYDTWQDLLTSRKAQIYVNNQWIDIIITKGNYTRHRRDFYGSQVEVSFQTANPYLTL